jgi:flagellar hook-length control protein FliK
MTDVTLLLNQIGVANRGESRGQDGASKQGNSQLFNALMAQQSAAKTTSTPDYKTMAARGARTDTAKDTAKNSGLREKVETASKAEKQRDNQTATEREALQSAKNDRTENSSTASQNHAENSLSDTPHDDQPATTTEQQAIADPSLMNNNLLLLSPFTAANNPVEAVPVNASSSAAASPNPNSIVSDPLAASTNDFSPALQQATSDSIAPSTDGKINDRFSEHEGKHAGLHEDTEISLTNTNPINGVQSPLIIQNTEVTKQAATVSQQAGELAQQVTVAIRKGTTEGTNQMHIKLNPVELGGIDIRMEVDADHHVRAILTIEKPETYDLLHKDAQHLQKLLEESGLKLADANAIQYEQRSSSLASNTNSNQDWLSSGWFGQEGGQAGRHAQNDSGYTAARHPGGDGDDAASTPVNLITYTHGQIDGRVNIRV